MMTEKVKLISKYDTLAQDCRELQDKHAKLTESYSQCQNKLDAAIGWTKFLSEPANVAPGNMNMIFFDIMLPKLLAWSKNKDSETKRVVASETFKKMIIFLGEKTQIFFEDPGKAESPSVLHAIRCFALITAPFFSSLWSWDNSHPQASWRMWDLKYQFEKLYEITRNLSRA
jgi:hypothetical protein